MIVGVDIEGDSDDIVPLDIVGTRVMVSFDTILGCKVPSDIIGGSVGKGPLWGGFVGNVPY